MFNLHAVFDYEMLATHSAVETVAVVTRCGVCVAHYVQQTVVAVSRLFTLCLKTPPTFFAVTRVGVVGF